MPSITLKSHVKCLISINLLFIKSQTKIITIRKVQKALSNLILPLTVTTKGRKILHDFESGSAKVGNGLGTTVSTVLRKGTVFNVSNRLCSLTKLLVKCVQTVYCNLIIYLNRRENVAL